MLDFDLAEMYETETKRLKEAVRRNINRFPSDFMFELTKDEFESLRTQIATTKRGGIRYAPFAFTEQRVSMLSSVIEKQKGNSGKYCHNESLCIYQEIRIKPQRFNGKVEGT